MLKRTPFYDYHVAAGGRMVDFAGWEMPVMYRSINDEHEQTRTSGSIFDVSHMGRLIFTGKDTQKFLDLVFTRSCADHKPGQCRYGLICNEAGGVMDDVILSRDVKNWSMVVNASNREKIVAHFQAVRKQYDLDFDLTDNTESTAMVALQGPKVLVKLIEALPIDISQLKRYHFITDSYMLIKFTIARTGYTGEDGVELTLPAKMAGMALKMLGGKDKEGATFRPAGLGARDTLRLEAGMHLYGHELNENIDPITAGLHRVVSLDKDFIGAAALRKIVADSPRRTLVGLELDGRRIARQGSPVVLNGLPIGEVTSGTLSPTLNKSIAMAYIDVAQSIVGTAVSIDLKGSTIEAVVAPLPFYKKEK